jgi:hypothetical protein
MDSTESTKTADRLELPPYRMSDLDRRNRGRDVLDVREQGSNSIVSFRGGFIGTYNNGQLIKYGFSTEEDTFQPTQS